MLVSKILEKTIIIKLFIMFFVNYIKHPANILININLINNKVDLLFD